MKGLAEVIPLSFLPPIFQRVGEGGGGLQKSPLAPLSEESWKVLRTGGFENNKVFWCRSSAASFDF